MGCTTGANGARCEHSGIAVGFGTCGCDCSNTGYTGANCETAAPCTAGANGQPCENGGVATGMIADNSMVNCGCKCTIPGYTDGVFITGRSEERL